MPKGVDYGDGTKTTKRRSKVTKKSTKKMVTAELGGQKIKFKKDNDKKAEAQKISEQINHYNNLHNKKIEELPIMNLEICGVKIKQIGKITTNSVINQIRKSFIRIRYR